MDINYQKFTPEQAIGKHLFVLHGTEIQLRNEIKDLLKQEINELADFKINVVQNEEFDRLEELISSSSGGSLFGDKILLIIQHLEGRFPETLNSFLDSLTEASFNNARIILETAASLPKNKSWLKQPYLLKVNCGKLNTYEEKIRLKKKLSFLEKELLATHGKEIFMNHEGNLQSEDNAVQILKLLKLNSSNQEIETNFSSNIDIFAIEDLILAQDFKKLFLHLSKLKNLHPEEIIPITWIANRVFIVGSIIKGNPKNLNKEIAKLKIWSNKLPLYRALFANISQEKINSFLDRTHIVDKANKGASQKNNWIAIEDIFLELESCL